MSPRLTPSSYAVLALLHLKPWTGYELTRRFYRSYGFVELEEFADLWGSANPALQMIKTVA